jgi:hypothetical protein
VIEVPVAANLARFNGTEGTTAAMRSRLCGDAMLSPTALVATTLNWYVVPVVREFGVVKVRVVLSIVPELVISVNIVLDPPPFIKIL